MLTTLSDKALLELARKHNDRDAGTLLLRRFLGSHASMSDLVWKAWRKPSFLTVGAAKKIALRQ